MTQHRIRRSFTILLVVPLLAITDVAGDATTAIGGLVSSVEALVQAVQEQECS